jgi:N-acetylglucosaminyldiphosphoundecaprenol N-acetyl-beta-D-mannosaminyltransferase
MIPARVNSAVAWAGEEAALERGPGVSQAASVSRLHSIAATGIEDDFSRDVYCVLGMPVDAVDMSAVVDRIGAAAASTAPFFISTPNLHFLISSQVNPQFRETLLSSDLCPADGVPVVWIARLLGVPLKGRVAGSDIFDTLKSTRPLTVFLFGGNETVAAMAHAALNAERCGLSCVGSLCPGFGTLDEMSSDAIIEKINASNADLLMVSLGAQKGQPWLMRNHQRLRIPIRAHLGAALNFQAGTVKRAPARIRRMGFEWLWRIKEEPYLWRRYWDDGRVLVRLLLTRVLPLSLAALRMRRKNRRADLLIRQVEDHASVTLRLAGAATAGHLHRGISSLRNAAAIGKRVIIDLSDVSFIDPRFFGLLLMLRKRLRLTGTEPKFIGISPRLQRLFELNGVGFLLSRDQGA